MKTLHLAACLSLLGVVACGDDTTSDTTSGSGGGGGSGGAGGGGAGGNAPLACGADTLATDLVGGTWDDRFTISGFTDHDGIAPRVNDFAFEPNGDLVAVGRFSWFEGQTVPPFMRFDGATQTWVPGRTTWELPLPLDGFQAVAIDPDGALALATAAASFPGAPKKGEIWLDTGAGLESIGAFDGQVRTITWVGGELWVAGYFALSTGGSPIANLAVWDGAAWNEPSGGPADGPVYEIAEHDGTVYVGGSFSSVGGIGASNVASFDGAGWTAYDFADAVAIFALTTTPEGELYAGGAYGPFEEASGVARWTGTDWQTVGGGLAQYDTRGVVSDLVAHDGVIDMIGCFSSAGGLASSPEGTPARSVARFDGTTWQTLDDGTAPVQSGWFSPAVCGDEGPEAIWDADRQRVTSHDGDLVVGGMQPGAGGVLSQSIIAFDGSTWVAQGKSGLGLGGSTDRFAVSDDTCDVYATGLFSHVAGEPATGRVLHFDGTAWQTLSTSLTADTWCPALDVASDGTLYLGCLGSAPDGAPAGILLRRDGDSMSQVDVPGLGGILSMAHDASGAMWIGGIDADGAGFVGKLEGSDFTIVGAGIDGAVNQLDVVGVNDVLAGGAFAHVGDVAAANIARFDGSKWSALGDGVPGQVTALAHDGATVYVSTYDLGSGAYLLGQYDGSTWKELASAEAGLEPRPERNFNRIRPVGGALVLGGSAELDDGSGRGVLVYRDGKFESLAGGVGAIGISDVAVTKGAIWVAGQIAQAGEESAPTSSVGLARYSFPAR